MSEKKNDGDGYGLIECVFFIIGIVIAICFPGGKPTFMKSLDKSVEDMRRSTEQLKKSGLLDTINLNRKKQNILQQK